MGTTDTLTRKEQFLEAIATGDTSDLPTPVTREEQYLKAIAENGGGTGGEGGTGETLTKAQVLAILEGGN